MKTPRTGLWSRIQSNPACRWNSHSSHLETQANSTTDVIGLHGRFDRVADRRRGLSGDNCTAIIDGYSCEPIPRNRNAESPLGEQCSFAARTALDVQCALMGEDSETKASPHATGAYTELCVCPEVSRI